MPGPTRDTYRGHRSPWRGIYYGNGPDPTSGGTRVTIERAARTVHLTYAGGIEGPEPLDSFGDTRKFWFAPDPRDNMPRQAPAAQGAASRCEAGPAAAMPYRRFPCGPCPIRADNADNPAAKFPAERWQALGKSVRDPDTGNPPMPGDILFGCHKGAPGTDEDLACAGWLARFGHDHIGVRLAIAMGRLPAETLTPGDNWPPLHKTWQDVVTTQTGPMQPPTEDRP